MTSLTGLINRNSQLSKFKRVMRTQIGSFPLDNSIGADLNKWIEGKEEYSPDTFANYLRTDALANNILINQLTITPKEFELQFLAVIDGEETNFGVDK